jgi:L-ascorbate metabolism protein UlaG (beta-lactamase superfamily)
MKILRLIVTTCLVFVLIILIVFVFMQQKSFGKLPSGTRLEKIQTSPNYQNGRFENLVETPLMAQGSSYWKMLTKFVRKGVDRAPVNPLPFVKTDLISTLPEQTRIVWFGHSSYLISTAGKHILVDPLFSRRASPVQFAGMKSYEGTNAYSTADMPPIDLLIISHDHYDHLDYGSIVALQSKVKLFCTPLGVGQHLIHWGVDPGKVIELDWWETDHSLPGFEVIATPARHFSGRGFSNNKTLWASFVLKTKDSRIFVGGDSGYDDSFKAIGEKLGPFDIAMLECGQYDVQWPYIHMMPEQVAQASLDLKARVLMPVHWAKFSLALHPWKEPIERLTRRAAVMGITVTTPLIGEPVVLNSEYPSSRWWQDLQ